MADFTTNLLELTEDKDDAEEFDLEEGDERRGDMEGDGDGDEDIAESVEEDVVAATFLPITVSFS